LPKRDLTATVTPATDLWLRLGPTWMTGTIREEIIWYKQYASERSASSVYGVAWRAPLNRITLKAGATYARAGDRPGYEIDTRAQRTTPSYTGSVELRVSPKTLIGVNGTRQTVTYGANEFFRGVDLREQLNRATTDIGVSLRHELTPLTSISLNVLQSDERFDFSAIRNSRSRSVAANVAFSPFALITGGATFGYRDYRPEDPRLRGYQGAAGSANITYTLLGSTRFTFNAKRDVEYSFDANQPYYLQTGFDTSIAQQIFGPLDVVGRAGLQHMAYRDRADTFLAVADRVDRVTSYGGGIGFHLGKDVRLGFNVDKIRRDSALTDRRYDNLRFGTAITYGF
jgi:hypothetical protein